MARSSALARLTDVLPPSPLPVSPMPYWRDVHDIRGYRLPDDYRQFIDRYGDGCINGEFSVFYPIIRYGDNFGVDRWEAEFDDYSFGQQRGLPEGRLIEWGGNPDGDRCFWFVDSRDPDSDPNTWPVYVYFRHWDFDDCWRRFDGGMAEFLLDVVGGVFEGAGQLVGGLRLPLRWHLHGDHETDYGDPPHVSLGDGCGNDHPVGWEPRPNGEGWQRLRHGSLIWLRAYNEYGGDQEYLLRTGKQRKLIELDDDHHTFRLGGGILAPGMAYSLTGIVEMAIDGEPDRIGIELLRDGTVTAEYVFPSGDQMDVFEQDGRRWVRLDLCTEILVPYKKYAGIQLRIISEPAAEIVMQSVQLNVEGVVGC